MNIIFSDGASRGNPGRGGYGVVVATQGSVKELGGKNDHTTNNQMELMGAIEGLHYLHELKKKDPQTVIYTDSSYVLNGITKWVYGWQKNGWKTKDKKDVLNKDLWQKLAGLTKDLDIDWKLLPGHAGVPGNERCDQIATAFADDEEIILFDGKLDDYKISLSVKVDENKLKEKNRKNQKAYSYVSLIDGEVVTHQTWAECEARVKGKKGAKYRKVFSKEEEDGLIKEWKQI